MKTKNLSKSILTVALTVSMTACNDEVMSVVQEVPDYHRSIEDAQKDLMDILGVVDGNNSRTSTTRSIDNIYTRNFSDNASRSANWQDVYIFNFSNEQGFAIMSTDTRIPSLLALANNGNLNENDTIDNPGLELFLSSTRIPGDLPIPDTFEKIDPTEPGAPYGTVETWTTEVTLPNGLCSVKWGQDRPYNQYCPVKRDTVCPTGCVPTAVAQLMSYYEYPTSYRNYTFDWPEMKLTYGSYFYTYEGANQLARLMQQLGLKENLDVRYSPTSSPASMYNIPKVFKSFGYSNGGYISDYNIENIVSEIKSNRPVIAGGNSDEYGHCWLIHGLMTRTQSVSNKTALGTIVPAYTKKYYYVMCNWGWNGYADGYYLSEYFDTDRGPKYGDASTSDYLISGPENKNDTDEGYFKKNLNIVTGIRK